MDEEERYETAKEVAGKAIGKHGLMYITAIVLIGVGSSYFLDAAAITAVMTMIGGALVALINMMNGIAGTQEKPDRPEFEVIQKLIAQLAEKEPSMRVDVEDGKVTVRKGDDVTELKQ
jgi:proteasome assembly chaperone (PAC2) family protein